MVGHGEPGGFQEMYVIALLASEQARVEEGRLSRHALAEYHNCCTVAPDARGQVRADNFLYVVVRLGGLSWLKFASW